MHRIDSVNARPNQNGVGKDGFNDNTDISGMDATYQTPEWCNALQEEIANVIAAAGIALNKAQNNQLLAGIQYLFQTYTDGEIDALTTAFDIALAGEAAIRLANDNSEASTRAGAISSLLLKIGAVGGIDLQTQINALVTAVGGSINPDYAVIPGGLIIQWATVNVLNATDTAYSFPITFPNAVLSEVHFGASVSTLSVSNVVHVQPSTTTTSGFTAQATATANYPYYVIGW